MLVLHGATGQGLVAAGAVRWTEASPGVPGKRGANERFGLALASADYGRSGRADLAIGTVEERVVVLYGRATGLSSLHLQSWSQDSPSVLGSTQRGDNFGFSLSP